MIFKNPKWKTPAILIGIAGLLLSFTANIIQGSQNYIVNAKADKESARADQAAGSLNTLQERKNDWLADLKKQEKIIDREIGETSEQLRLHQLGTGYDNFSNRQAMADSVQADSLLLYQLQQRKFFLDKEMNDFLANWR